MFNQRRQEVTRQDETNNEVSSPFLPLCFLMAPIFLFYNRCITVVFIISLYSLCTSVNFDFAFVVYIFGLFCMILVVSILLVGCLN
jgi:hypothetical protein